MRRLQANAAHRYSRRMIRCGRAAASLLLIALSSACSRNHARIAQPTPEPEIPPLACGTGELLPESPIEFGKSELGCVLKSVSAAEQVIAGTSSQPDVARALSESTAVLDRRPESYAIFTVRGRWYIAGSDPTGVMYGALELAERIKLDGITKVKAVLPITGTPKVPIRAANPFLVLPDKNETAWWFYEEEFWRPYLDLLAHSRMNYLDIHGMYNLENTSFPNLLLYFATSPSYPLIGAPPEQRARNMEMLKLIVAMAKGRGIKVGLMTYSSDTILGGLLTPQPPRDPSFVTYTREAARDLATSVPDLWRLGFRIGESGKSTDWYEDTIIAGVREAGTGVLIYTRTWGSTKEEILRMVHSPGTEGTDVMIEAKFNGEQLGPPYPIAGGHFHRMWPTYSYENYLEPPAPYTFVFQIRAGGTHRIFRYASFERTRRTVETVTMSNAKGYTLEPTHAFFPQRDYYHRDPNDKFSEWTFRRDELEYLLFGRLAYDPTTPETVFREALKARVGTDDLWEPMQAASEVVPWIQTVHTCGPDHRDYAPELEWGGPTVFWAGPMLRPTRPYCALNSPFDIFALALPIEAAADLVEGRPTTRISPVEVGRLLVEASEKARSAKDVEIDAANDEARDVQRECIALGDLGAHAGHKLRGASAFAVYTAAKEPAYLEVARQETLIADAAYRQLVEDTGYIEPFVDNLRMTPMGVPIYHWREEARLLRDDMPFLEDLATHILASPRASASTIPIPRPEVWLNARRGDGPGLASLRAESWAQGVPRQVTATLVREIEPGSTVNILWKPMESRSDWQSVRATQRPNNASIFEAPIVSPSAGVLLAVEVIIGPGQAWRYPDMLRTAPYVVVPPPF